MDLRGNNMNDYKNVAIITSGYFPVPASKGGAVEALDENVIKQNEISKKMKLTVFSCFDEDAKNMAERYHYTEVVFIKIPYIIRFTDKLVYWMAKNVLRKKKNMSFRYIFQRLYYIVCVAYDLKKNNYDRIIVENHSTLFLALKYFDNHKKYDGKYYYHLHNVVTKDYGCREIIANCKKVLGVSNYINSTLQSYLGKADNNHYYVWRNKINREEFRISLTKERRKELIKKFNIDSDDVIVLFTGRFNEEKGIKQLLLAFKKLKKENVKLLIVGSYYFASGLESEFEIEMKKLAESLKDKIEFTGYIEYKMMPELYALADIVVIPSMWEDPAPLTVIESLTSGNALITTNSGGIPEYADPISSIIIKRDELLVDNLCDELTHLIDSKEKRNKMQAEVIEKTKNWTVESFYDDFCQLIDLKE